MASTSGAGALLHLSFHPPSTALSPGVQQMRHGPSTNSRPVRSPHCVGLSVFAVALAVACLRALASPFCIANDMVSLKRRSHATSSSSACATQSHEFGQAQEWARFYSASGRLHAASTRTFNLTSSCPTSRARDQACISRVPHALGMNCSLRPVSTEGLAQTCRAVLHCRTGHRSVKSMTEELWDFEFHTTSMHSTFFLTCRTPVTKNGDSRLRRRTGWTRTEHVTAIPSEFMKSVADVREE